MGSLHIQELGIQAADYLGKGSASDKISGRNICRDVDFVWCLAVLGCLAPILTRSQWNPWARLPARQAPTRP